MSEVKLMKTLFYEGNFNVEGKRMRAIFVREVTNGTDSYRLWQSVGKPDLEYPRAENDAYILHVEFGEYLAPLGMTDYALVDHCGYSAAVVELYGDKEKRSEYFNKLRESGSNAEQAISEAIAHENERIRQLGNDSARQADFIKSQMDQHVSIYTEARDNGGQSFPDFIGALVLGDLSTCEDLSSKYKAKKHKEAQERQARAEAEVKVYCDEQNRLAEQKVQDALAIVKSGGILQNEFIRFYRNRCESTSYSIVNYLMRKYGVNVPLRTQGWINEKLISATIENGHCGQLRYVKSKGAQCSQRFFDCINELIRKVCVEMEA